MRNLQKYIQENYEREALQELQQWEKWELRYSDSCNHRKFTLRCINKGIVLVSLKLNSGRKNISSRARGIIYRAERQLLQERVRSINTILIDNGGRIATSRPRLLSLVTAQTTQLKCTKFINQVRESRYIMVRDRQVNKFNRFNNRDRDSSNISTQTTSNGNHMHNTYSNNNGNNQSQSSNSSNNTNKWVVNLSKTPLIQAQESLLSKGPNYAIAPNNPPNVVFITATELACHKL